MTRPGSPCYRIHDRYVESIVHPSWTLTRLPSSTQLNFVDSSGLIFFFKIQKHLVNSGKRCVLCAMTDNVNRLFRLTKLNQLFRITPDLVSAQQMLEEPTT